jgi:hypothetical protein
MLPESLKGSYITLVVEAGEHWPLRAQKISQKSTKTKKKSKNSVCIG